MKLQILYTNNGNIVNIYITFTKFAAIGALYDKGGTITEDGNYDFYIYCYDKNFQEPQYLNGKRFRDENGKLTEKVEEISKKTLPEARNYYINGDRYENNGKIVPSQQKWTQKSFKKRNES